MDVSDENVASFKEFCAINDDDIAMRYLIHCHGDLQAAVQLYFQTDGVLNDDPDEDDYAEVPPMVNRRNSSDPLFRNHGESFQDRSPQNAIVNSRSDTSRWSVVQPWRQFFVALVTLPFNFVISTIFDVLKFFYDLVVGERMPAIADFREDVANFRRAVFEIYGATRVEFFDGTFDEAFLAAADGNTVFAAYLFTPGSRYSEEMVRQVLMDDDFNETLLNFNIVLWGADPRSSAGKDAAYKLRVSTFPSFAALSTRDHSMLMRVEMPVDARQIWPLLRQCALEELEQREEEEFRKRVLRENRQLMEQQEREYRESEERDRAVMAERRRQQQLKEAELLRQQQEEKERQDKVAWRLQELRELRDEFLANGVSDDCDGADSIRVIVRYPSGETSQHKFALDDSTKKLFEVIFVKPNCPNFFEAHYGFPRVRLDFCPRRYYEIICDHRQSLGQEIFPFVEPKTFRELGITSSLALYINDVDS
ncbi:UBX domain-containing protein [Trichostrongylus colubriformis]|uniref:UBX domain-containing protein n=1 Tax=Trichostrongylus colubriformis TaxID=6319 RepID=A0AAN8FN89_TRICO